MSHLRIADVIPPMLYGDLDVAQHGIAEQSDVLRCRDRSGRGFNRAVGEGDLIVEADPGEASATQGGAGFDQGLEAFGAEGRCGSPGADEAHDTVEARAMLPGDEVEGGVLELEGTEPGVVAKRLADEA